MPGTVKNPVILDPFQKIVSVGWGSFYAISANLISLAVGTGDTSPDAFVPGLNINVTRSTENFTLSAPGIAASGPETVDSQTFSTPPGFEPAPGPPDTIDGDTEEFFLSRIMTKKPVPDPNNPPVPIWKWAYAYQQIRAQELIESVGGGEASARVQVGWFANMALVQKHPDATLPIHVAFNAPPGSFNPDGGITRNLSAVLLKMTFDGVAWSHEEVEDMNLFFENVTNLSFDFKAGKLINIVAS